MRVRRNEGLKMVVHLLLYMLHLMLPHLFSRIPCINPENGEWWLQHLPFAIPNQRPTTRDLQESPCTICAGCGLLWLTNCNRRATGCAYPGSSGVVGVLEFMSFAFAMHKAIFWCIIFSYSYSLRRTLHCMGRRHTNFHHEHGLHLCTSMYVHYTWMLCAQWKMAATILCESILVATKLYSI